MCDDFVSVNNLNKTFDNNIVLKNISLCLKKGEMTSLVGPDGAGKTTFLRLLCGLLLPDEYCMKTNINPICKSIKIEGFCPYENLYEVKKIIGYMPQKFGLYEDLSVIENLNLYKSLNNIKGKNSKIDELLNFAGLFEFKNRLAGNLSGGMKQKLGLCCTLISEPKLLLLDEPSVGVDPLSRRELMKIVEKLVKNNNITVIWSTSYLDEAEKFDRVFLFSKGEKIYDGSPKTTAETLKDLVFLTYKNGVNNRALLRNILKVQDKMEKPLIDGIIEGDKIRIVFDNKKFAESFFLPKIPVAPRFEDFVIYKLKKIYNKDKISGENILKSDFHKPNSLSKIISSGMDKEKADITISASGLTKIYGKGKKEFIAANNVSFEIKKGEIFGLLGPNGAGKSTTFKMLCGLIRPTTGKSSIMGIQMNENPSLARSYLGYTAQKFSLFGNLSVRQNLNFFAGVYGLFGLKKQEKINMLLNFFDLEKYANFDAQNLPLGYKQRLALSCAVVHNPPVLFLDEPTSGVDPLSRREFWAQINSLSEGGTTILITTHFMDEAQFCDRICLIFKGKVLTTSTPDELKHCAKTSENLNPTMEDAFISLIEKELEVLK